MTRVRDILLAVLVVAAVAARLGGPATPESAPARSPTVGSGAYYALSAHAAKASDRTLLTEDRRVAELRFAADVDPSWRQAVLTSIARARPEAARLIGLVDGLVEIKRRRHRTPAPSA